MSKQEQTIPEGYRKDHEGATGIRGEHKAYRQGP